MNTRSNRNRKDQNNKSGGQRLIEQLYVKYYDSLMIIACSYTHDKATAEDLVQNMFLKALLSYEAKGSFLGWANRVLRNDFYNLVRANRRFIDEPFDSLQLRSQDDLLSSYIHSEERAKLAAMISMLPMKYREVMIESVYLQKDNQEIASALGLSPANVRQIKSRAKKLLLEMKENEETASAAKCENQGTGEGTGEGKAKEAEKDETQ